jgi:hypothetical protein
VNDLASHDREHGTNLLELLVRYVEVVVAEDDEIRQLTGFD